MGGRWAVKTVGLAAPAAWDETRGLAVVNSGGGTVVGPGERQPLSPAIVVTISKTAPNTRSI